jgi:hypothetical protein
MTAYHPQPLTAADRAAEEARRLNLGEL